MVRAGIFVSPKMGMNKQILKVVLPLRTPFPSRVVILWNQLYDFRVRGKPLVCHAPANALNVVLLRANVLNCMRLKTSGNSSANQ